MSKAMELVGIILLGIFTLVIINLMNDVRSTNELDYYLLQETVEASMYDAIDYSYYRDTQLLKVDRDMFLESFTRRFAESVDSSNLREYKIKIIDFNETPPKASVEVTTVTAASVKGQGVSVVNRVDGIIETIYDDYVYSRGFYQMLVNPIPATQKTETYAAVYDPLVYTAVGDMVVYDAKYTAISSYDAECHSTHADSCRHCTINGKWEGYKFCEQNGIAANDDSCGDRVCDRCNNGDSLSGDKCIISGYTCPQGGTLEGDKCKRGGLTCPQGGVLNESAKTCTLERYTCPNGGLLSGRTCEKTIPICPEGTILKEGNVCVTSYDPR